MKMCPSCGVVYDTTHFYKDNQKKDKLYSICKSCYKERARLRKEKALAVATEVAEHNATHVLVIIVVSFLIAAGAAKFL